MGEGVPMMYHGNGFGGPGQVYVGGQGERAARQYPLELLQVMGGVAHGPRRWQPRRHQPPPAPTTPIDSGIGYESDDSSLSSNASGSNKEDKGEEPMRGGGHGGREWRRGARREARPPRRFAPDRYFNVSYPFQVKYTPDDLLNGSEYDTLSQEIWDRFMKAQQMEETFRKKMSLWRYLYIAIKSIFPRYGLYMVGSTMTGFGLDSSDMDLCLFVRPLDNLDERAHALAHLSYMLTYIRTLDPGAELIQAKVPILKFREARLGLQVDLNCNNTVGVKNTDLLTCFSRIDWRVRPLVVIMKLWAQAHNINDARQSTLSSYSLTLMVIHFLQCGTSPGILPRGVDVCWAARRPRNRSSLAELFINLLAYYADFPYSRMAVSVRLGARLPLGACRGARAHKNDPHQWKLLCVEEPFELTNAARAVYEPAAFARVRAAFRGAAARAAAQRSLRAAWPAPAPAPPAPAPAPAPPAPR